MAAMLLAVAVVGCGDDGDETPDAGAPGLSDVQDLVNETCAGSTCHVSFTGQPGAGMDLRPASLCANVINVDAVEVPSLDRVVPGNPETSYLLCKVTPGCDDLPERALLMPQGSNGLPDAERNLIADWIQAGAPGCNTGIDTTAPRFDGVQAVASLSQAVRLTWAAATDDVTQQSGIEYLVYVAEESGAQDFGAEAATETARGALEAEVSGLEPGRQYFFVVRARDAAGNIDGNTEEIVGSPLATIDNVAPTFTGAGTATARGATLIELTWNAATDDVSAAADIKYNIYMAEGAAPTDFNAPTFSTPPGATSAFARGLRAGNTYFFVIRAEDAAGNEDDNTTAISETTEDDIFFPQDIQPILTARCATVGCHVGPNPAEEMDLSEGNAYDALVGTVANQCEQVDNRQRVEPNDVDNSYLIDKIEGIDLCDATVGVQSAPMPKDRQSLSDDEVALIRQWIQEGAREDGTPGVPAR